MIFSKPRLRIALPMLIAAMMLIPPAVSASHDGT